MKANIGEALQNTELVYGDLKAIADEMFSAWVEDTNKLVKQAELVNELTNDQLRELIFKLAVKSFSFGEIKEKALMKAAIAESLRKEAYAVEFAKAEGAVAAKDATVTQAISSQVLSELVYNLVASLFKTKLDEIHRLIDSLKTILMSRISEAKLAAGMQDSIQ